ncbi:hypothetical protein B9G98_03046 [Wickerhamiella sorbophila]|uniref:Uncharacterized protein n=1 Tax=Wickerhamiella sorbophila TaxID=45607 RepID=A0A2T0FKB1_9ASCO|nr:hypothetical protein B9G98_03046 [Wickerhamiella sorbophila]PRT55426.1 hypothetical protein B9G98_03046 [Wickerhamiella sorbophila]
MKNDFEKAHHAIYDFETHLDRFNGREMNMSSTLKCTEMSLFSHLSTQVSIVSSDVEQAKAHQLVPLVPYFVDLNAKLIEMLGALEEKADTFMQTSLQSLVATQVSALSFPFYELNSHFLNNVYWAHNDNIFNSVFVAAYSAASAMANVASVYSADVPQFAVESKGPAGHFVFYLPKVTQNRGNRPSQLDEAMPMAQERCDTVNRFLHSPYLQQNQTALTEQLSELSITFMDLRDLCRRQMQRNLRKSPQLYVEMYQELLATLSLVVSELDLVGRDNYRLSTELTVLSYPVQRFSSTFLQMIADINCKYFPKCLKATRMLADSFKHHSDAVYHLDLDSGQCTTLEIEWEQWGRWLCVALIVLVVGILLVLYFIISIFENATDRAKSLVAFLNQNRGNLPELLEANTKEKGKTIERG